MKTNLKLTKMIVMATIAINSSLALADKTSAVSVQEAQIKSVEMRFEALQQKQKQLTALNEALGTAEKTKEGWTVVLDDGKIASSYGFKIVLLGGAARYYQEVTKGAFSRLGKKPTNVAIAIAGIAMVSGIVAEVKSTKELRISEGDMIIAQNNIDAMKIVIDQDKTYITKLAENMVKSNIVTVEGLPQGIRDLMLGQSTALKINQ